MYDKIGTMMIDGRIIDFDNISREELEKIEKELKDKEKRIREEIDKLLEE